jgi:hypothetical protein
VASPDLTDLSHDVRAVATACPLCGLTAASAVTRLVRGVVLADYMCHFGHAWFSKWVQA